MHDLLSELPNHHAVAEVDKIRMLDWMLPLVEYMLESVAGLKQQAYINVNKYVKIMIMY